MKRLLKIKTIPNVVFVIGKNGNLVEGEEAKEGDENGETADHSEDLGCVQIETIPEIRIIFWGRL